MQRRFAVGGAGAPDMSTAKTNTGAGGGHAMSVEDQDCVREQRR